MSPSNPIANIIYEADNRMELSLTMKEEVRVVAFQMPPDKAPRPNGFPTLFFQEFWEIVGDDVWDPVDASTNKKMFWNTSTEDSFPGFQRNLTLLPPIFGLSHFATLT